MSLTAAGPYDPAPYTSGPSEDFGRTPPQDVAAEQSVLGGMMLSKDAIADVIEQLRGGDFYRPAHELVFEAVLDLYGRGEPADAVTVSAELTRRGELGRVGGAAYLHTLISSVPTAANAGYYAEIVRDRAVLRRLVDAGTKIVQLGYASGGGDVDDLVNQAQAEVYQVTERRTSEDYVPLSETIEGTINEIEISEGRGDEMIGVPTGFADLDQLTNGLHPGQMVVMAARPAMGKALALDTPLATPSGWTTMGAVQVGDQLLAADGTPTRVVRATTVLTGRPCYEVSFDDGTTVVADAWHEWFTDTRASRRGSKRESARIRTTEHIASTLRCQTQDARLNHSVRNARPLALAQAALPVDPYVLGAWLGDGATHAARISTADAEMVVRLEGLGLRLVPSGPMSYTMRLPVEGCATMVSETSGSMTALLRKAGVLGNKHIPAPYLRASESQRRALLAGLLDTDGTVNRTGGVQFAVAHQRLADDFCELLASLGYRWGRRTTEVKGRSPASSTCHTITFTTADEVFWLSRKQLAHKERSNGPHPRVLHRFITAARPIESVPVRCVEIDHPDHLYLASRAMIPTHNSTAALDIARSCSIKHGKTAVIFSLEMSRNEITMRLLSAEASVNLQHMRKGTMREEDWTKLARTMGRVSDAPLFIDDSPNMSLMEIRAKCRRLKQRHDLKLVIIDYLQLMSSGKRVESRQQEVSEFSRALKLLAKELEVPVIAVSQLNRGAEQRTDKKPAMSDLRESGCLTADTRILRADTGAETTMGELHASGAKDVPVWALDDSLRYVRRHLTHVFSTGHKAVFQLRLASGKQIRATANHPFLTYAGWTPLEELSVGSRVGVPRHVPAPETVQSWDDSEVVMLAHLLGDGSFVERHPIRYASVDETNLYVVSEAARHWGITAVRDHELQAPVTTLRLPTPDHLTHGRRNPIAAWLDALGLLGLRSHEKFVPPEVHQLSKRQIGMFLRHIWSTDGSVAVNKDLRSGRVSYASTSLRLVEDLSRLLLRFGISTRVREATPKPGYRVGYTLEVSGVDNQQRFLQEIGVQGDREGEAEWLLSIVRTTVSNPNGDTVPVQVWDQVREILADKSMPHRALADAMQTQFSGSSRWKRAPSRQRLSRVAEVLDDADLEVLAVNDLLWDQVVSIESDGVEEVFDATVLGTHNFIANGIAVHNSIEQDADIVILLHREDAYEKESPRAGEADFIVAKHRNGPTANIVVAFQGHFSRFVDMAHD